MIVPNSIKIDRLTCQKCDNKWFPRADKKGNINKPKLCPSCKQKWDRPKIYQKKK